MPGIVDWDCGLRLSVLLRPLAAEVAMAGWLSETIVALAARDFTSPALCDKIFVVELASCMLFSRLHYCHLAIDVRLSRASL